MGTRRTIRSDLIVLHTLGSSDQGSLLGSRFCIALNDLLTFFEQSLHPRAILSTRCGFQVTANLFNALCVNTRLLQMRLEGSAQVIGFSSLCHLRQRFEQLSLGTV